MSFFEIFGEISQIQTIARGKGIRERQRLVKHYGPGNWTKKKGIARIIFNDGQICSAEIHWYEAHGTGRVEFKIKELL